MEVNDILNAIKSNLTGDSEADKLFLAAQIEKYADFENGEEIIEEISKIIWDLLSDEEKEVFRKSFIDSFVDQLKPLVIGGDTKEALERLNEFIDSYPFDFENNDLEEFHIFNNPIENILFIEYYTGDKKIKLIPFSENYYRLFNLQGHLLWDLNDIEKSKEAFLKALKYNPVDTDSLTYLMMYYDLNRDNKQVEKLAKDILKYSYDSKSIAHAYRFLGYWYFNYEDYETSAALYILSLLFEDHISAKTDLSLINKTIPIKDIDAVKRLKEMDIQVGVNPVIFDILMYLYNEASVKNDENMAVFCQEIFSQLIKTEDIPYRIAILEESFDDMFKIN